MVFHIRLMGYRIIFPVQSPSNDGINLWIPPIRHGMSPPESFVQSPKSLTFVQSPAWGGKSPAWSFRVGFYWLNLQSIGTSHEPLMDYYWFVSGLLMDINGLLLVY